MRITRAFWLGAIAASALMPPILADEKSGPEALALEATRTVEFETDQGTWLSVDISPDGSTIIFELLGDLYRLPIGGGEAEPLLTGMAFESQPAYSPDGKKIAFLSDRSGAENVWISSADGADPRQLSKDEDSEFASPTWTRDGRFVIVSRSSWGARTFELWMYHVDGGAGVQVTKAKLDPKTPLPMRHNALGAVASPDGRYLYYAQMRGGFQYNAKFPQWQIARRDLVTGDEDVLTNAQGSAFRPAISPDGRSLVYGTRHDAQTGLRVRDLVTGDDRWLIYPVQRDDQESRFTRDLLPGYSFTPDGAAIVLSFAGKLQRVDFGSGAATPIEFTAAVSQGLGPQLRFARRVEDGPIRVRLIQTPTESPGGDHLAFSAMTRLFVRRLPNGELRQVGAPEQRAFHPAWSPDGAWLAYVTWSPDGGHVWRARADGGAAPERVTQHAAFYASPVWSPDAERLVVLRASAHERTTQRFDFSATGMDVVWIPAGGGEARLVVPARGVGSPHFGDDPERIYAYLGSAGLGGGAPHGLYSMRFDGTDRRAHLKVTGSGVFVAEEPVAAHDVRISPDGRWALAHVGNQLYLVAVPRIGGEAPVVNVGKPSVPIARITDVGADYFSWVDGGATIAWSIGATWYRRPLATVSFEQPDPSSSEAVSDEVAAPEQPDAGKETSLEAEPAPLAEDHESVGSTTVELEVPRSTPAGSVILRGARIVTMNAAEVINGGDILVTDGRFAGVGPTGVVEVPDGAPILDVTGKTIVPGFVDTHAHWFDIRRGVLDVQNWSFMANLAYGVTAGLDVQTGTNDMFAYQDLADAGEVPGPRAFSTGPGIFSDNAFKSLDQVRAVMRRYKEHYRTGNLKAYVAGNRKVRQWIVAAAAELEMMPTTEGALDLKLDLTHVIDGFSGNEHALPIVPLFEDVVRLHAESGTSYTPTLLVAYGGPFAQLDFYARESVHDDAKLRRFVPHGNIDLKARRLDWFIEDDHVYPRLAAQAAKIHRAGGLVGVGSHGELQGLGYHWEMWSLAAGGLTPREVLKIATLDGARIIGYADDLGSIEVGKLADLVVLDGNPLEDIRHTNTARFVMRGGRVYDAATLDEVWPEERALQQLWWWDDEPVPGPARASEDASPSSR